MLQLRTGTREKAAFLFGGKSMYINRDFHPSISFGIPLDLLGFYPSISDGLLPGGHETLRYLAGTGAGIWLLACFS
jgi:hypothetical protein